MKFATLSFALLTSLAACAAEKSELDATSLEAIDIEGKEDSWRSPTVKGPIALAERKTGRVTQGKAYHGWDYTHAGPAGAVRVDARSSAGRDLVVAAYRRSSTSWVLDTWNDDCDASTLDACVTVDATSGTKYRFVVSTYNAMVGAPIIANYSLETSRVGGGGGDCGGIQGLQCGAGEYCAYALDAICGAADQLGTCQPMPDFCTQQYDPVCGCDGQTYGNACMAASAGAAVSALGECAVACGARAGDTCGTEEYCRFERLAICGQADGQGVCETRPQACTAQFAPVCGCDNQTYSNECVAASQGQGVLHDGACQPQP